MWDIRIQGGSLIKPLEQESKERYIQCVADMGVEIVDIAITAEKDMDIKIGGEKVNHE